MNYECTPNGIPYDSWLMGPDGAGFELFPIRNVHDAKDVLVAKMHLRKSFDVLRIVVSWIKTPKQLAR